MNRGIVFIAYGQPARAALDYALESVRRHIPGVSVVVVTDTSDGLPNPVLFRVSDSGAREAKVNLHQLSPFEDTCYLDADTRVQADLSAGFQMLEDGWELVIAPSANQTREWLWHVSEPEREVTREECGLSGVQLQGGVFFFRKSERMSEFFDVWHEEWARFRGQDQAALLRALYRVPLRVWLLGRAWNGGAVIQHQFGAIRA